MNCFICNKPLPVKDLNLQQSWFGLYKGAELVRAICKECRDTPAGEGWHLEVQDAKA